MPKLQIKAEFREEIETAADRTIAKKLMAKTQGLTVDDVCALARHALDAVNDEECSLIAAELGVVAPIDARGVMQRQLQQPEALGMRRKAAAIFLGATMLGGYRFGPQHFTELFRTYKISRRKIELAEAAKKGALIHGNN